MPAFVKGLRVKYIDGGAQPAADHAVELYQSSNDALVDSGFTDVDGYVALIANSGVAYYIKVYGTKAPTKFMGAQVDYKVDANGDALFGTIYLSFLATDPVPPVPVLHALTINVTAGDQNTALFGATVTILNEIGVAKCTGQTQAGGTLTLSFVLPWDGWFALIEFPGAYGIKVGLDNIALSNYVLDVTLDPTNPSADDQDFPGYVNVFNPF